MKFSFLTVMAILCLTFIYKDAKQHWGTPSTDDSQAFVDELNAFAAQRDAELQPLIDFNKATAAADK